MTVFTAAMDRIYSNPSMAVAALWMSATTSEERTIRVIRRAPDRITEFGAGRFVSDTVVVDVRDRDRCRQLHHSGRATARPRTPDLVSGPAPIMKQTPGIDPDPVALMAAEVLS